ncbi:uncharacterized protein Bfra_006476 [Botrytis fragariae]|uniref:Uncharacterized protein n=1 Tax=Botrytis fragariae TaxID=1964551 RepID=A0A8H6EPC0_9HELO|nr:uncharacterized protein Bfra_006476 [Botrytis fragariae]KAF5879270.1 hypothetical protein Bfra_006476 [Botrytis fragariae]
MVIYQDIAHHQPDHSDGPGELSPVVDLSLTAEYTTASKVKAFCDFEDTNEDARRPMHGRLLTVG